MARWGALFVPDDIMEGRIVMVVGNIWIDSVNLPKTTFFGWSLGADDG